MLKRFYCNFLSTQELICFSLFCIVSRYLCIILAVSRNFCWSFVQPQLVHLPDHVDRTTDQSCQTEDDKASSVFFVVAVLLLMFLVSEAELGQVVLSSRSLLLSCLPGLLFCLAIVQGEILGDLPGWESRLNCELICNFYCLYRGLEGLGKNIAHGRHRLSGWRDPPSYMLLEGIPRADSLNQTKPNQISTDADRSTNTNEICLWHHFGTLLLMRWKLFKGEMM